MKKISVVILLSFFSIKSAATYHFDVILGRSLDHSYNQYRNNDLSSFNSFAKDLCFSMCALNIAQNIAWLIKNNWNADLLENRDSIADKDSLEIINDVIKNDAIVNCSSSYLSSVFTMPLFRKNKSLICLNLNCFASKEELRAALEHEMSHVKNNDADKKLSLFFLSSFATCYLIYAKSLKQACIFNFLFNFFTNHFIVRKFERDADNNVSKDLTTLNAFKAFLNRIYLKSSEKNKEYFSKWFKSDLNLNIIDRANSYMIDPEHPYFQDRIDAIDLRIKDLKK